MKRFLLVLLSLILILLPSCNAGDKQNNDDPEKKPLSYPDVSMSEEDLDNLRSILERYPQEEDTHGTLDVSKTEGNLTIESAFTVCSWTTDIAWPERLRKLNANSYSEELIILDEKELLPEASGEYIYLFFVLETSTTGHRYVKINSAMLIDGVISLEVVSNNKGVLQMAGGFLFALKIPKDSLSGEIKDINVEFNTIVEEEKY